MHLVVTSLFIHDCFDHGISVWKRFDGPNGMEQPLETALSVSERNAIAMREYGKASLRLMAGDVSFSGSVSDDGASQSVHSEPISSTEDTDNMWSKRRR